MLWDVLLSKFNKIHYDTSVHFGARCEYASQSAYLVTCFVAMTFDLLSSKSNHFILVSDYILAVIW